MLSTGSEVLMSCVCVCVWRGDVTQANKIIKGQSSSSEGGQSWPGGGTHRCSPGAPHQMDSPHRSLKGGTGGDTKN